MNRTLVATRLHLINWRWSLLFPLGLVGLILLFNLGIGLLTGSGGFTTGGLTALYVVVAITQLTAMTQFFSLALGLSLTRREFYLGTWLFVLLQSVAYAVVLTVALAVERATGGWGTGLGFFRFGVPADTGLLVTPLLFAAMLLALAGIGGAFGVVFTRFGQLGVWTAVLAVVVAAMGAAAYIGWREMWPQFLSALVDPAPSALIGYPLLVAVVLAGAGWLGLRRATP